MNNATQQNQRFIKEVLAQSDIVDVISEVVALRSRSGGEAAYMGKCPFHADRSPSFSVSGSKQVYHCFGCDAGLNGKQGGDVITFVQRQQNLDFRHAVHWLATRYGVRVPETWLPSDAVGTHASLAPRSQPRPTKASSSPAFVFETHADQSKPDDRRQADMLDCMSRAHTLFSGLFANSESARTYLHNKRRISPRTASRYAIGYAPDGFGALKSLYPVYDLETPLIGVGLVKKSEKTDRYYDFFRNRLLFGIRNQAGQVIAYGGRDLGSQEPDKLTGANAHYPPAPKYLNSPDSIIFNKRNELFGLYEAQSTIQEKGVALIVEGYMDVLGLAEHGFDNAVASMGTAITTEQLQRLIDCGAKQVIFTMDGDEAGQKAMQRAIEPILATYDPAMSVRFVALPDGLDPDEFISKHSANAFSRLLASSIGLEQFMRAHIRAWTQSGLDKEGAHTRSIEREVDRLFKLIPAQFLAHPSIELLRQTCADEIKRLIDDIAQGDLDTTENKAILVQLPRYIKQLIIAANRLPILALNKSLVLDNLLDRSVPAQNMFYKQFHLAIGMGMKQSPQANENPRLDAVAREVLNNVERLAAEFAEQSANAHEQALSLRGELTAEQCMERIDKRVRMREN